MKGTVEKKVNLFEYDNYRVYLKDLYNELKGATRHFSYRYFSKMAGFRSPNFLKLVMDGNRNLSADGIEKFSRALRHNKEESIFFRNLVLLNQAVTLEERKFYAEQLIRSRFYKKVHPLKKAQYHYYTNWYFIPIRELVALKDFREDPEWIAHRLSPPITAHEAKQALVELEQLGLIKRNDAGTLVQTDTFVSTGDEVTSTSVAHFHKEMIQKGAEAIDRFDIKDRDISSVTLGLSRQGASQVKDLVSRFRKELMVIAKQEEELEGVYQVNFQLFPLTVEHRGESQ